MTGPGERDEEEATLFKGLVQPPTVNMGQGTATMSFPLIIPPGRKSTTPNLSLIYSGGGGEGPFGHGWALPLGRIERLTKNGVPGCDGDYTTNEFMVILPTGATELVYVGNDTFRGKVDEAYFEIAIFPTQNRWEMHDRSGTLYKFGNVESARTYRAADVLMDTVACAFTSRWGLTEIQDPNGNTIEISYVKDERTLYPDEILYGGNPGAGKDHPYKIRFEHGTDRDIAYQSHSLGHKQRIEHLVDRVEVQFSGNGTSFTTIRGYDLQYKQATPGGKALLEQIDGDGIPSQTFTYSSGKAEVYGTPFTVPAGPSSLGFNAEIGTSAALMDMNGDGITDYISASVSGDWAVFAGNANGMSTTPFDWDLSDPAVMGDVIREVEDLKTLRDTFDITGDGIPDFVDANGLVPWRVYPGYCDAPDDCGFGPSQNWTSPYPFIGSASPDAVTVGVLDVNGDGLPDLVHTGWQPNDDWFVYLNNGSGFDLNALDSDQFAAEGAIQYNRGSGGFVFTDVYLQHFDMNGDGLPDRVEAPIDEYVAVASDGSIADVGNVVNVPSGGYLALSLKVYLNNGHGFAGAKQSYMPEDCEFGFRYTLGDGKVCDFMDINGDGLPDLIVTDDAISGRDKWGVLYNQGAGFLNQPNFGSNPHNLELSSLDLPRWKDMSGNIYFELDDVVFMDMLDWNADGFPDRVEQDGSDWEITLNGPPGTDDQGEGPYLLKTAENGIGGVYEFRYGPTSNYDHDHGDGPDMPFLRWVVTGVRQRDGLCDDGGASDPFDPTKNACIDQGHDIVKTYAYQNGLFDAPSKEFRGFRSAWEYSPDGPVRHLKFNQEEHLRCKLDLEELLDENDNVVRTESYVWETKTSNLDSLRNQVYLAEHRIETPYDTDPSLDQCVINRNDPPDDYGRVSTTCTLSCNGAPATPGSCATKVAGQVDTTTSWGTPEGGSQVWERPEQLTTIGYDGQAQPVTLMDKYFYYDGPANDLDGLSLGRVVEGNLKREISILDQSVTGVPQNQVTITAYDDLGNVTKRKVLRENPSQANLDNPFETVFDTTFGLLPIQQHSPDTGGVAHVMTLINDLATGLPTAIADENSNIREFAYDVLGRLACRTDPGQLMGACNAGIAERRFYVHGNPAASGFAGKLSYAEIQTAEPNNAQGYVVTRAYFDGLGRPRLATTERIVEGGANLETVVSGQVDYDAGSRAVFAYGPYVGSIVEVPLVSAGITETLYHPPTGPIDPLGRAHKVRVLNTTPLIQRKTRYEGRRTVSVNGNDGEVVSIVDDFGNEIRSELRDGAQLVQEVDRSFDGLGHVLSERTAQDSATDVLHTYDTLGRRIRLEDPDSGIWEFGYDLENNLVFVDDPQTGQHLQSCFDELSREVLRCAYGNGDSFQANACTTDCGGFWESRLTYDETAGGNQGIGRPTSAEDQSGTESSFYDFRGRVTSSTKTIAGEDAVTSFSYDDANRVDEITYPFDLEPVTYTRNQSGDIVNVDGDATYLDSATYDLRGRPSLVAHGNGVDENLGYHDADQNHRLESVLVSSTTQTHLSVSYGYDALSKVEQITDSRDASGDLSNSAMLIYDQLGRLKRYDWLGSQGTAHADVYDYDDVGNLDLKGGQTLAFGSAGPHQVTNYGSLTMSYAPNGGRTFKGPASKNGDWQEYDYNSLDRIAEIRLGSAPGSPDNTIQLSYDHTGRRVLMTTSGAENETVKFFSALAEVRVEGTASKLIKYYFAGDRLIASAQVDYTPAGAPPGAPLANLQIRPEWVGLTTVLVVVLLGLPGRRTRRRGMALGPARASAGVLLMLTATVPLTLGAECGGGGSAVIRHYHVDYLGSTQALSNAGGGLVHQVRYKPYGDVRGRFTGSGAPAAAANRDYRREFTGYETERLSELQYAGARFYDPELGQFTRHDPARQFVSPYAYTDADPANAVDPTGTTAIAFQDEVMELDAANNANVRDTGSASGPSTGANLDITLGSGNSTPAAEAPLRGAETDRFDASAPRGRPELSAETAPREISRAGEGDVSVACSKRVSGSPTAPQGDSTGTIEGGPTPVSLFGFEVPGVSAAPPRITFEGGLGPLGVQLSPRAAFGGVDIGPFQNIGGTAGTILPEGGFVPDQNGTVSLPAGPGKLGHIFRTAAGHVNPSTLSSQSRFLRLFQRVASSPANRTSAGLSKAASEAGVQAFTQTFQRGRVWVQVRNGRIINGGVNR